MFFYKIPAPNEAMVVSGSKRSTDGAQFRIVTGRGAFVFPWTNRARWLSLDLREALISEVCVTKLRIPLTVEAVAVFKVGDDNASIANAARRFLDQQQGMERLTSQVLAGHLRSIVGGLTVEEIIGDRNRVAQEVKSASTDEMEKLGLVIDAFQIQEIKDDTGYINNLAAPHAAAVARDARIAAAQADQAATEKEQEANALKAGFVREAEIKQAGYRAEIEQAQAAASPGGPACASQGDPEGDRRADKARPRSRRRNARRISSRRSRSPPTRRPTVRSALPRPTGMPSRRGPRLWPAATRASSRRTRSSTSYQLWWKRRPRGSTARTSSSSTAPRA